MRSSVISPAILVLSMSMTIAATAVDDTVKERQQDMKEIAAAAKAIAGFFKNPETYSSDSFRQAATAIGVRADQRLIDHFATRTVAEGSKATEAIAAEPDRFAALARDLKSYADALASAADKNPGAMSDDMRMKPGEPMGGGPLGTRVRNEATLSSISAEHAFHLMLQTCSACHTGFRSD
ncbi:cytochrome C [Rhizobium sp. N122]|nr:cytochrome C [Rhizobium sp. N122]